MRKLLFLITLFLSFGCVCLNGQTKYYKLTRKVINGQSSTDVSGGQFICFTKDGCYESDKEGFSVNNGSMKYKYTDNGILIYTGSCYWGNASFKFNADKSKLNVVTGNGDIYVYSSAAPPSNQITCSLIKKAPSSSFGGFVPVYPVTVYDPEVTTINSNVGTSTQENKRERTPSKRWRNVTKTVDCNFCHHSGKCNTCNGKGWFYSNLGSSTPLDCPNCDGFKTGRCRHCHGAGYVQKIEQVYE